MLPIVLVLLVLAAVGGVWLAHWLLIRTEGVFLGRRVVVWLYDLAAGRYDAIKQFDPDTESAFVTWPLRRRLKAWPAPLVLDVATGTGRLPYFLLQEPEFNGGVIGLDASAGMLAHAQVKLAPFGDRAALVRQSALDLPFGEATFAAVTCLEALEFLPDTPGALREMVRVLQPGGVLLVSRRQGADASYFLGHTYDRDAFEELLGGLGLVDVRSQPWQVDYELVWATRSGG
ncbi:MAG: class I SAM-dependent methyltransferase [Anaerolineae bacterium]|uniref:class I SAM-dependent methyltransferase n=1 Tax=Promineifilum sp. TaxID=2664178 RepID=UPI001D855575|nr:class I SAM-dependent methyltransferase [Anaerolineales bacterium]MCO5179878.1 class I SAM-dependent methyltransferase [Promineifilum sp.]MCW5847038.1 class I SAM-dependent methyltransferase [Anaerolineae bacterium]